MTHARCNRCKMIYDVVVDCYFNHLDEVGTAASDVMGTEPHHVNVGRKIIDMVWKIGTLQVAQKVAKKIVSIDGVRDVRVISTCSVCGYKDVVNGIVSRASIVDTVTEAACVIGNDPKWRSLVHKLRDIASDLRSTYCDESDDSGNER